MSTTQNGTESGGSNPEDFDFTAYIAGVSSFPEFQHTVYLDQANGIALHAAIEEYDQLAARGREINRLQERMAESATRSLVDEEAEELNKELDAIVAKTTALEPKLAELEEKVRRSAVTLHFRTGTAQKLGQVVQAAEKEFHKKHGRKNTDDIEYITAKSKHILTAQLAAYCTKISLPDGREQDAPDASGFEALLDKLISSESVRLMTTLNKSLDSSGEWADRIDAGFPGGRSEQAEEPLGGAGAADGPGLDAAAADAPARNGIGLG